MTDEAKAFIAMKFGDISQTTKTCTIGNRLEPEAISRLSESSRDDEPPTKTRRESLK